MYRNIGNGQRWGRAERMVQIQVEMHNSRYDVHTVNSIAKLISMTPSQHLRGILADMCSRGDLLCSEQTDEAGTVTRRLYALPGRAPKQAKLEDDYIVYKRTRSGEKVISGINGDDTPQWSSDQGAAVLFRAEDAVIFAHVYRAAMRKVSS